MNREIKFRGLLKDKINWVCGYFYRLYGITNDPIRIRSFSGEYDNDVIRNTLTQFTGKYDTTRWSELTEDEILAFENESHHDGFVGDLKSKWKGKRIWEGDIVKRKKFNVFSDEMEEELSYVVYDNHGFHIHDELYGISGEEWNWSTLQVVGNIFQNPELVDYAANEVQRN